MSSVHGIGVLANELCEHALTGWVVDDAHDHASSAKEILLASERTIFADDT